MAGRKPKPTALKMIQGNPGKRKLNDKEPKGETGIPDMPEDLSDEARLAWDLLAPKLLALGVLATADGLALQGLAEAHADWLAAREEIVSVGGLTYTTDKGLVKANPAVAMRNDADRRRRAWLAEFGLTPAARSRVAGPGKNDEKADPWEDF